MNTRISDAALPVVARYVGRASNIYRYIAEDLAVVDAQIADEAKKPEAVRLRDELRERAEHSGVELPPLPISRGFIQWHAPQALHQANGFTSAQMQEYARAALAATGKHGDESCASVEAELQFYREHIGNDLDNLLIGAGVMQVAHEGGYEACWKNTMEAVERLAATGKQQVGEVQGDEDLGAMKDLLERWQHNAAINPSPNPAAKARRDVWVQCLSELKSALAARQPVGQQAIDVGYGSELIDPLKRIGELVEIIKANTRFNVYGSIPASSIHAFAHEIGECAKVIAAPPAQAMDLGPVIEEAIACFNAAECEGWHEALAEGDIERIRDLWNRRIEFAYRALIDSRQTG